MERCLWCWCYFAKAFARNRSSSNSNSVSSLGKGWNCEDQPAISHWEKYTISQVIQRKFFRWCLEAPNRAIGINNWHLATFTARGLWGVVAAALLVAFQATLDVGPLLEAPAHTCHFMSAVCSKPRWKESQVQPLSFMDASTKCIENATVDIPNNILLPLVVSICGSPNITPLRIIIPNRAKARMEYYEFKEYLFILLFSLISLYSSITTPQAFLLLLLVVVLRASAAQHFFTNSAFSTEADDAEGETTALGLTRSQRPRLQNMSGADRITSDKYRTSYVGRKILHCCFSNANHIQLFANSLRLKATWEVIV